MAVKSTEEEAVVTSLGCSFCNESFASRNQLFRHLRENHVGVETEDIKEPPSKLWAEQHQTAPEIHAKVLADNKKKTGKKKNNTEQNAEEPIGELHIETRPEEYSKELQTKVKAAETLLQACQSQELAPVQVFESPREHFRMRVEFDISQIGGPDEEPRPQYIMHRGKTRVVVREYPMACKLISEFLMPKVLEGLHEETLLTAHLFQVNFHTTLAGDAMVSLLYHTPYGRTERRERMEKQAKGRLAECDARPDGRLSDEWVVAAERLQERLGGKVSIIGRSRGKKRVVGTTWVEERLEVKGAPAPLLYRQLEGCFSQPNATVCQSMLSWARAMAYSDDGAMLSETSAPSPREDDLLELYCGNGNFCVALAPLFRRVLATELVKDLVDVAQLNAARNHVDNIEFGRVSAEELALALTGSRSFCRLKHLDLSTFNLSTVLVDPPRAGLGPEVSKFVAGFARIVYISCNPVTLQEDLALLTKTHRICRVAAFDQFPYTDHLEMGVLLSRMT